jgi:septum formation protein
MSLTKECAHPTLILASGSPRRRDLLSLLGLPFVVQPSDVEEANHAHETCAAMVTRLSQAKAQALAAQARSGLIVAADTTVCLDGEVVGKPADPDDAIQILRRLRGRAHTVFSSVTLTDAQMGWTRTELAESQVLMRNYSDEEIATYVASGDPLDKAGAYAIQYADFRPVARIIGCYANVMGFPLCHVYCMLRQVGRSQSETHVAPAETPVAACDRFNRRHCDVAKQILKRVCEEKAQQ